MERQAKPTLTAVEMDRGDSLRFTRMDGRTVDIVLLDLWILFWQMYRDRSAFNVTPLQG